MNRRNFVRLGVASALPQAATEISEAQQKSRPKQSRPNILMIMADQLRADCLGAYGNRVVKTPHIDRIAAEGVTFTNAYTCVPSCTPARSALSDGPRTLASRHVGNGPNGHSLSGRETPHASGRGLLYCGRR